MAVRKIVSVEYLPPGGMQWRRVKMEESPKTLKLPSENDRLAAVRLLREADRLAKKIRLESPSRERQNRERQLELTTFERDMSAAVGAWDRWVKAESRKLFGDTENRLRDLFGRLKR